MVYLISNYFKDLYLYLAQNKLPSTKTTIYKVETLAEKYILLDSLLFKFVTTPKKETVLLAIPEMCQKDYYIIAFYFIFRTPRCDKNVFNYQQ